MARRRWLPYAAVALLAGAVFAETLRFGFVFDDEHLIVNNLFLRQPWSPIRAFAHHFWYGTPSGPGYYRPIVIASLALNGRLLGWGPGGFHLVNLLLHAVNACLVLTLGRRLRLAGRGPELAAALFAVHPAAAWPVASIVARVDLLPALFILLAWIGCASADSGEPRRRPLASALLTGLSFLAALLCKESAVAFLAVPLLGPHRGRKLDETRNVVQAIPGPARMWQRWGTVASTCAAAGAYVAIRSRLGIGLFLRPEQIDPLMNPLSRVPFPERLWGALALAGRYLLYLLLPARFDDPRGYSPGSALPPLVDPWTILGALLLCGWAGLLVALWRREDRALAPLAFTLASFLPASNLLVPIAALYAQNFLYLPLLGLALAAGDLCGRLRRESEHSRPSGRWSSRAAVAVALLVVLGVRSAVEARIWSDCAGLFGAWTARFPCYAIAHGALGSCLLGRRDPAAAIPPLRQALALDQRSAEAHHNLAIALVQTGGERGPLEEALDHERAALRLSPGLPPALANAARILLRLDRPAEAEREAREALRLAPDYPPAVEYLALSLARLGRPAEAAALLKELLGLEPDNREALGRYVAALVDAGDLEEATRQALAARQRYPDHAWFDFCLARIHARSGHRAEALALLRSALDADPAAREWIGQARDFARYRGSAEFEDLLGRGAPLDHRRPGS